MEEAADSLTDGAANSGVADQGATEAALRAEIATLKDRVLRAEAETENTRKRLRRDADEQLRYAAMPLAKEMLGVLDNLERALGAADGNEQNAGLKEGVKMVAEQMKLSLARHNCREIDVAVGGEFDPHRHEALGQEPSAAAPAGAISRVVRAGYQMHDRVVRAAQVLLSTGKPS